MQRLALRLAPQYMLGSLLIRTLLHWEQGLGQHKAGPGHGTRSIGVHCTHKQEDQSSKAYLSQTFGLRLTGMTTYQTNHGCISLLGII